MTTQIYKCACSRVIYHSPPCGRCLLREENRIKRVPFWKRITRLLMPGGPRD